MYCFAFSLEVKYHKYLIYMIIKQVYPYLFSYYLFPFLNLIIHHNKFDNFY